VEIKFASQTICRFFATVKRNFSWSVAKDSFVLMEGPTIARAMPTVTRRAHDGAGAEKGRTKLGNKSLCQVSSSRIQRVCR
jgi:hypothetical protein